MATSLKWWKKPERTTDNGQQLANFIAAASEVHPFCILQSRARTHAVLVIGVYELLCSRCLFSTSVADRHDFNRNKKSNYFRLKRQFKFINTYFQNSGQTKKKIKTMMNGCQEMCPWMNLSSYFI